MMAQQPVLLHTKRHHFQEFYGGEPPAKRPAPSIRVGTGFKWNLQTLANAADAVESGGKSPVSALNELGVRVSYRLLDQGGPPHCPSFTVAVTVADMTFEGWGHSKREARAAAARACLGALLARAGRVLPAGHEQQDFTVDDTEMYPVSDFQCLESKIKTQTPVPVLEKPKVTNNTNSNNNKNKEVSTSSTSSPGSVLFGTTTPATTHKSPINILYESYSGLVFHCTFGDGSPLDFTQPPLQLSHSMRFKVVCQIKDQKFEGYGSSKKLAKLAAARSALAVLQEGRAEAVPSAAPAGCLHQTLADHVGKLVNEKFNELMKNDLVHSKRKVLAGIVITIDNRIEDARVIAVTTGTKCVSGEHMSVTGRAVNDCHAEVAARRCLQRHLYAQLLMYANQPDPRLPLPDNDLEPVYGGGYQMKQDRQLHLYVSTAPCGDGRIFSPHENGSEPDKHPNRLARGQLRTKIESGEGTIPVKNCTNVVQTWDGVMQGERLLTMSCSDKVARWCVSGLQGALLSRYIRPVYLHSLVLGSLLHPHHMYRAICGRIESYLSSLPPPFRLHRPLLARAASTEARTPTRAPSFSVCWSATTPLPEIINATTGKLECGQPSLLCKQSMFARWRYLIHKLPQLSQETDSGTKPAALPSNLDAMLYNEAKALCSNYQLAKQRMIEAFEKAQLGRWIKNPLEQDQFVCELLDADPTALFAWVPSSASVLRLNVRDPRLDGENVGRYMKDVVNVDHDDSDYDNSGESDINNDENYRNDVKIGVGDQFKGFNQVNDESFGEIGDRYGENLVWDGKFDNFGITNEGVKEYGETNQNNKDDKKVNDCHDSSDENFRNNSKNTSSSKLIFRNYAIKNLLAASNITTKAIRKPYEVNIEKDTVSFNNNLLERLDLCKETVNQVNLRNTNEINTSFRILSDCSINKFKNNSNSIGNTVNNNSVVDKTKNDVVNNTRNSTNNTDEPSNFDVKPKYTIYKTDNSKIAINKYNNVTDSDKGIPSSFKTSNSNDERLRFWSNFYKNRLANRKSNSSIEKPVNNSTIVDFNNHLYTSGTTYTPFDPLDNFNIDKQNSNPENSIIATVSTKDTDSRQKAVIDADNINNNYYYDETNNNISPHDTLNAIDINNSNKFIVANKNNSNISGEYKINHTFLNSNRNFVQNIKNYYQNTNNNNEISDINTQLSNLNIIDKEKNAIIKEDIALVKNLSKNNNNSNRNENNNDRLQNNNNNAHNNLKSSVLLKRLRILKAMDSGIS